ncbi:MAG: DEAD/DEAH box helicase [Arcobacteraceae bacterium]
MAKNNYGTTLWGNEFLQAIEEQTDSGRLSRGKNYANTGKVFDVNLEANHIKAKVKGNSSPFYKTSLHFTPFIKGDSKFIIEHINANPLLLADIMNSKLSNELLEFLKENEIDLFSGFDMNCNCYDFYGDYACKHIAGLYFMLVNEIDKNPFILFSLRGLDLIEHFNIKKDLEVPYPIEIEFLDVKDETKNEINKEETFFKMVEFTNVKEFILSLLDENPTFATISYKTVLDEFYKKTTKELPLVISPIFNEEIDKCQRVLQEAHISFRTTSDISEAKFHINSSLFENEEILELFSPYADKISKKSVTLNPTQLFNLFISFENEKGSSEYEYLFYTFRVAYILLYNSAFIPCVYESKKQLQIFYKPLTSLEKVAVQLEYLEKIAPVMAFFDAKTLTPKSQTQLLLSAILTDFVPHLKFMHKAQKNNPPKISYSFFQGTKYKMNRFEDENLAYSIKNYFAIFELIKSDYTYKLLIDKPEKNYEVKLMVQEKTTQKELLLNNSLEVFNKMQIVKFVSFIKEFMPTITQLLQNSSLTLSKETLEEFLLKTATLLTNLGVLIILPKELKNLLKPKLSLSVKSSSKSLKSFFTLDKMLQYDWQLAIGDEQISIEEFNELLSSGKELIEFKGNFVLISPEEAKAIFAQINKKTKLNSFDILQAKLNNEAHFSIDLDEFFEKILTPLTISVPKSLQANLREYQQRGFEWNIHNLLHGFGTILADDMGLGKTIQAIATLLYLTENKHIKNKILIVVPTTLLNNWEKELDKFAPTLSYFSYYGTNRVMQEADIIISTYDIVRLDIELFKAKKIDCLIIDEAQKIKNPDTAISKSIKMLKAKYKIALSGTPVENNLSELWSIFDFALPKYLKSLKEFVNNYAKDIEINQDRQKIEQLKKITAPFMLRRLKSDKNIISDLPDKIVIDEYATMSKEQASLYQNVVDDTMKQLNEKDAKGLIFKLIIALKQICNHPRNFDKVSPNNIELSGKTQLLMTLLDNIIIKDEKVLIFTQYVEMGNMLVELIQKELLTTPLFLKGDMSKKQRDETVEMFQTDNRYKIFILSLKAGGVGLNLTAANHVIHYDLWFNPAVENQATDRAFRIGQNKKVTVHRFITKNSFEEKIDKMIKAKQELCDLSVNIGENWLKNLDKEELKSIFS